MKFDWARIGLRNDQFLPCSFADFLLYIYSKRLDYGTIKRSMAIPSDCSQKIAPLEENGENHNLRCSPLSCILGLNSISKTHFQGMKRKGHGVKWKR